MSLADLHRRQEHAEKGISYSENEDPETNAPVATPQPVRVRCWGSCRRPPTRIVAAGIPSAPASAARGTGKHSQARAASTLQPLRNRCGIAQAPMDLA